MSARVAAGGSSSNFVVPSLAQREALQRRAPEKFNAPVPETALAPGQVEKRTHRVVFYLTDSEYTALARKAPQKAPNDLARRLVKKAVQKGHRAA